MLLETLLVRRQAGQELGGPSCLALWDVSSSPPWCQRVPVLGSGAGRRSCARGLCLACRSAFQAAPVGPAGSESAAGRRRWWALLLLLPREPLSHQIRFPQAHQEVSVLGLFWWASTKVARN